MSTHTRRALLAGATTATAILAGCLDEGDDSRHSFATPTPDSGMSDNPTVTLGTNHGEIAIELFAERAPRTVENFLNLAEHDPAADEEPTPETTTWEDPETGEIRGDSLYEGTIFHRIIPDFMIQGGDPTGTGRGGPGYEFDDEFHPELRHDGAGILSMANSGPNTNGSQFFITLDAQPHLDDKHAVFGQVIDGMDVVKEIGNVPTGRNDKPHDDVEIQSVDIDR
jgi:peptidyl-prolyl cis-trans isomerase A (cyclophilin A)